MNLFDKPGISGNWAVKPGKIRHFCLTTWLTVVVGCAATSVSELNDPQATAGFNPKETDKLFVVDCLLPAQIRKVGAHAMYLTARRPIQTTAGDCETRGGEYVAYDRANAASSLRVWLEGAQKGDPEAQVKVGEIYQKGLGGLADPKLAAEWYLKAAEKGNSEAQINLGYLYEKGLGVKQDKAAALNWYRKASGLAGSDLQFSTVIEAGYQQQLNQLREESKAYKEEAENLRAQLDATRQQLAGQKSQTRALERQLDESRRRLQHEQGKAVRNTERIESLRQEVETKQSHLQRQQQRVSRLEKKLKDEEKQIASRPEPEITLRQEPKETPAVAEESGQAEETQVNPSEDRLAEMEARLKGLESEYQADSAQINMDVNAIEEKAARAKSTQEKLAVETLRSQLARSKNDLFAQGRQIRELKQAIAIEKRKLAEPTALAAAGPVIEILEPRLKLTRGTEPSYRLRSESKSRAIVGKVLSPGNLESLKINELPVQPDREGIFKFEIALEPDSTPVHIVAVDKQNRLRRISFNLLAPAQERQIFAETAENLGSNTYPSIHFGKFYALIIGNNHYAHLPTLKTSANDARAVDEVLRSRYGFRTTLLIDADRHQIMSAFNDLRQSLSDRDNLLIYYAGHGEIDKSDENAYWLPTDAEPNNNANWLSSFNVTKYLNVIQAKHILVIADSCYAGAMTQGSIVRLPGDMPEDKRERWLNFMMKRKARTVMTSGGEEPVLDSGGGNHSVFAKALLKALNSNQGLMVDYELFRSVATQVRKSASTIGFRQTPEYSALQHAGHEGSPFFFIVKS